MKTVINGNRKSMRRLMEIRPVYFFSVILALFFVFSLITFYSLEKYLAFLLSFILFLLVLVLLYIFYRLTKRFDLYFGQVKIDQHKNFRNIQAIISLYNMIKPEYVLPDFGGWAISPDMMKKICENVIKRNSCIILECGSGVSTLTLGYLFKQKIQGHIYSLEHDQEYIEEMKKLIRLHGLGEQITLIYAPLKDYKLNGANYLWYDIKDLPQDIKYDTLIVDGPPASTNKNARYPAYPLLKDKLNERFDIYVDDYDRQDEMELVEMWERSDSSLIVSYIESEKGGALISSSRKRYGI